jgi:hypothetical protein
MSKIVLTIVRLKEIITREGAENWLCKVGFYLPSEGTSLGKGWFLLLLSTP